MDIEFRESDGSTVVRDLRIEQAGNSFLMKMDTVKNSTHFLVFEKKTGGRVNLQDNDLQKKIISKKDFLPDLNDERLTDDISFSCIGYEMYRYNEKAIPLSGKIAEYTVVGCRNENGKLIVFIPASDDACTASVTLTVRYSIRKVATETRHRLFGKDTLGHAFYEVSIDKIPSYSDGAIVYRLDGISLDYPVTTAMIENGHFFVEASKGEPKLLSNASGIELCRH